MGKKFQFKQHFATALSPLTERKKKNHGFSIPEHYFGLLYNVCTHPITKIFGCLSKKGTI